jgi:glycosidase
MQKVFRGFILLVPLLTCSNAAPWTEENSKWNTNVNSEDGAQNYKGKWEEDGEKHKYFPSPEDWRGMPIYQLITDRFSDGDPTNNEFWPHWGGYDVRDHTWRHGGDFRGITERLDYLRGLGVRTLWISPIFQNGWNQYHQYAQTDFTLIDRRLGTLEDLRVLTSSAHERGMYVIIDVVVNHMADCLAFVGKGHAGTNTNEAWRFNIHQNEKEMQAKTCHSFSNPREGQPYKDFEYNNEFCNDYDYTETSKYAVYDAAGYPHMDKQEHDKLGSYCKSDFHHNGQLEDYQNAWQINLGKIYGLMDDIRTEAPSVQAKHIAMTKALIESADVDGFRVDTPMQVDLGFFKAWVPAVKQFAESLGKSNFGIWGEFYVTTERFTTMTGRGKDNTMYSDPEKFIDNIPTLNAGIQYNYWGYWMWKLFADESAYPFSQVLPDTDREKFDGIHEISLLEKSMIDMRNPQTGRVENTMWHFCNNHDQRRMQVRDNFNAYPKLLTCMVWMTFWPGIPTLYAGDEQLFMTPGSALDGWAREELTMSHAWRALRSVPLKDNFDMTHQMYRYTSQLNELLRLYFDEALKCDQDVTGYTPADTQLFVWERGCLDSESKKMVFVVNFGTEEQDSVNINVSESWKGAAISEYDNGVAVDLEEKASEQGTLKISMDSSGAKILVRKEDVIELPPRALSSFPGHDQVMLLDSSAMFDDEGCNMEVTFDKKIENLNEIEFHVAGNTFHPDQVQESVHENGHHTLSVVVPKDNLKAGLHKFTITSTTSAEISGHGRGTLYSSRFRLGIAGESSGEGNDVTINPLANNNPLLISEDFKSLAHTASCATKWRARNINQPNWETWKPINNTAWDSKPGVAVLVQYFSEGSTSYFQASCRTESGDGCDPAFNDHLYRFDGDDIGPHKDTQLDGTDMELIGAFTWTSEVRFDGRDVVKMFFCPHKDYKHDTRMGWLVKKDLQRSMESRSFDPWNGKGEESIMSLAQWSAPLKITKCCRLQATDEEGLAPESCDTPAEKCYVIVNDLTLQIKVSTEKPSKNEAPHGSEDLTARMLSNTPSRGLAGVSQCKMTTMPVPHGPGPDTPGPHGPVPHNPDHSPGPAPPGPSPSDSGSSPFPWGIVIGVVLTVVGITLMAIAYQRVKARPPPSSGRDVRESEMRGMQ